MVWREHEDWLQRFIRKWFTPVGHYGSRNISFVTGILYLVAVLIALVALALSDDEDAAEEPARDPSHPEVLYRPPR